MFDVQFRQYWEHTSHELVERLVLRQKKAGYIVQIELQPSPLAVLLSSHYSIPTHTPSPHTVSQSVEFVKLNPVSHAEQPTNWSQVAQLVIGTQSMPKEQVPFASTKNPLSHVIQLEPLLQSVQLVEQGKQVEELR